MIRLFVDVMGGDKAPAATVEGSMMALAEYPQLFLILGGKREVIEPLVKDYPSLNDRFEIVDCREEITNHEAPAMAVRQKKDSSIVRGMLAVREGLADGFVSAGSTGGVLMAAMLRLGRIPGIERPAIAPLIPHGNGGFFLLIDGGANVDCQPDYLYQFGLMGDCYMRAVRGIAQPRVGLINIGDEAEKGNALVKATFPLMENAPYHFVGNVEARDIPADKADVLVCDGFSGNLVLKYTEGLAASLLGTIKKELMADTRSKMGALLAKPAFKRVKKDLDYTEVGGAPLLGVAGAVVKAHGSSNAYAFKNAIRQALTMVEGGVVQAISTQLKANN